MNLEAFELLGSDREWRQISMYSEIMSQVTEIPGDIIEFGVASGASFKAFVRLNNLYNQSALNEISIKTVFGFDSFEGLPELDQQVDFATTEAKNTPDMKEGGFDSYGTLQELEEFCKTFPNAELRKGLFSDSIPEFINQYPHASFSLVHIDCDIYSSSKDALSYILPRLNVGGIILFDEIFHKVFPGETKAFWEVYNSIESSANNFKLQFYRVKSMPWKWYCIREY